MDKNDWLNNEENSIKKPSADFLSDIEKELRSVLEDLEMPKGAVEDKAEAVAEKADGAPHFAQSKAEQKEASFDDFMSRLSDMSEGKIPEGEYEELRKQASFGNARGSKSYADEDRDVFSDSEIYGIENKSFYESDSSADYSDSETEDIYSGSDTNESAESVLTHGQETEQSFSPERKGNFKLNIIENNSSGSDAFAGTYEDISSASGKEKNAAAVKNKKKKKKKSFWRNVLPYKGDSVSEIVRKSVFLVAILTFTVCACYFVNLYALQPFIEKINEGNIDGMKNTYSWEEIHSMYPDIEFPENMKPTLAQAYAENNDCVGWLEIEGINLSTPVVQTSESDFYSYYLKHNFYKKYSKYGCPFLSSDCGVETLSRNTVIFGHNMEYDDLMFGVLEEYRKYETYKKAPKIVYKTLYKTYTFDICSVYITPALSSDSNYFNYTFTDCSDERYERYVREINDRSLYDTGVELTASDKIITLSTCTYDYKLARLAVVGKLSEVTEE